MSSFNSSTKPIDRIIVHIGQHKTGSSSIQQSLYGLNRDGVRYADLGAANQSGKLNALYAPKTVDRKRKAKLGEDDEQFAQYVTLMRAQVERELSTPCSTLIFSAEDLELLTEDQVRAMRDHMTQFAREVRVVVFVRSYFATTVSALQQRIKAGYGRPEFIVKNYRKNLAPYLDVFGLDNMRVLEFHPSRFVDGSLLRTFLAACDLPDCDVPEVRANESQSDGAVKILYALNRIEGSPFATPAHFRAHNSIRHTVSDAIKGRKFSLTPAVADRTAAEAEITWLRDRVGLDFSADLAGMSPDQDTAAAAFRQQMAQIDADSLASLFDLVEAETGHRARDVTEAVRALFDARLAIVQQKGPRALRPQTPEREAEKARRKEVRQAQKAAERAALGRAAGGAGQGRGAGQLAAALPGKTAPAERLIATGP